MKYVKTGLFLLLMVMTKLTSAQDKAMYATLDKLIKINTTSFYTDKYFEKGFIFSVNIGVNTKGRVDTVVFSHYRNDDFSKLVNFEDIRNGLMKNKTDFLNHKNEMLVLLVMIIRGDDAMTTLTNGNQIRDNWSNIIDMTRQFSNKKQIFLTPMLISSVGRKKEF